MRPYLPTIGLITVMSAAFLYGGYRHLRNTRHRRMGLAPRRMIGLTDSQRRLLDEVEGYQRARRDAEEILREAHTRLAPLYEEPSAARPSATSSH